MIPPDEEGKQIVLKEGEKIEVKNYKKPPMAYIKVIQK
jgi:phage gp45-like